MNCDRCGVVFKLTPNTDGSWTESVLHRFLGGKGGGGLAAGVILDTAGNLYGTTFGGGINSNQCTAGCGVVFELTPNANGIWPEKLLHRFAGGKDGQAPVAGVIFDQPGNLYGTTSAGGNPACYGGGCGLVFKLAPNTSGGWKKTVLATFRGFNRRRSHGQPYLRQNREPLWDNTRGCRHRYRV